MVYFDDSTKLLAKHVLRITVKRQRNAFDGEKSRQTLLDPKNGRLVHVVNGYCGWNSTLQVDLFYFDCSFLMDELTESNHTIVADKWRKEDFSLKYDKQYDDEGVLCDYSYCEKDLTVLIVLAFGDAFTKCIDILHTMKDKIWHIRRFEVSSSPSMYGFHLHVAKDRIYFYGDFIDENTGSESDSDNSNNEYGAVNPEDEVLSFDGDDSYAFFEYKFLAVDVVNFNGEKLNQFTIPRVILENHQEIRGQNY